jgi:hypothetical protein
MTRPFRDVAEPTHKNQRVLMRLRRAPLVDFVDLAYVVLHSRFLPFTRKELGLPC